MKRLLLTLIVGTFCLAGCNTFEGLGKDVQKAGETIEGAAKKK
jgi:predicted small secreted protein